MTTAEVFAWAATFALVVLAAFGVWLRWQSLADAKADLARIVSSFEAEERANATIVAECNVREERSGLAAKVILLTIALGSIVWPAAERTASYRAYVLGALVVLTLIQDVTGHIRREETRDIVGPTRNGRCS